jgi:hypothetical protein
MIVTLFLQFTDQRAQPKSVSRRGSGENNALTSVEPSLSLVSKFCAG